MPRPARICVPPPHRPRRRYHSPVDSEASDSDASSNAGSEELGDESAEEAPKVDPGMRSEIRNLYEGKPKCRCCINWVDEIPKDTLAKMKASKRSREYAIVVRHKRDPDALDGELKVDSIVIQSPLLKPVLEKVFKDLPGTVAGLEKLQFAAPFVPFFHRWEEFKEAHSACEGETRLHADLLYDALQKQIEHDVKTSRDLVSHGVITFEHIWTLFIPGDLFSYSQAGHDSLAIISKPEYFKESENKDVEAYTVSCRYVDVGRTGFGQAVMVLALPKFTNTMKISEMMFQDIKDDSPQPHGVHAMPAKMRPDFESLKTRVKARGRTFEALKGYHFKEYKGDMEERVRGDKKEVLVRRSVATRIVIDAEAYERHMVTAQTNLLPLDADLTPQGAEIMDEYPEPPDNRRRLDMTTQELIKERLKTIQKEGTKLTDDQLLLCSSKVKGYSLKDRSWGEFYVDLITDIKFNKTSFTNLVLPESYRDLISSFVSRHLSGKDGFDDFIPGKGRGLIVLLSGEPGVGKTLTAESVAEEMEAPLYSLGAGELGSFADDVDDKLADVFELCSRWKAVLLLDEADVFLEQRTTADMERNKIVSVFLRVLEYYEGMMFMTTNRVSAFDAAFRSRIHINMDYPPLNTAARKSIWSSFLDNPALDVAITQEQIATLAEKPMNGREIKNTIKIASLLAGQKKEKLEVGHLASVLSVNGYGGDSGYVLENDFRVL